jgi:hypothetical protein
MHISRCTVKKNIKREDRKKAKSGSNRYLVVCIIMSCVQYLADASWLIVAMVFFLKIQYLMPHSAGIKKTQIFINFE